MTSQEAQADAQAQSSENSKFTKRVALITACFAVFLSIAAMGGSNTTKDTMLGQQQASNFWSYYQAKVIREHLYASRAKELELMLAASGASLNPAAAALAKQALARAKQNADRYKVEKAEIMRQAKQKEAMRDLAQIKDPYFDWAQIFLQVAIIVASIAMIITSGWMFVMNCVMAFCGVLLTFNGYVLFMRLAILH